MPGVFGGRVNLHFLLWIGLVPSECLKALKNNRTEIST